MPKGTDDRRVDLVFQGGGIKGIGLVGAYSVLEERGFRPQNIAGTSAGAIVGALVAAGYTASELHDIIGTLDFTAFLDRRWEDRIPVLGPPLTLLKDQGIYEGEAFLRWMDVLLRAKGVETFADLLVPEFADDPLYRHRLQVVVSDVTDRRLLVLPRDARQIGYEPDDLGVAAAVRMSMSIPIFFEPVRLRDAETGVERVLVDGGMLSNFPVWLFDSRDDEGPPAWPTFGLKLVDPTPSRPLEGDTRPVRGRNPLDETVRFLTSLVSTMTDAHDKLYLEKSAFVRTITIPNLGLRATEFSLSPQRAEELFRAGREAAETFLRGWSFEAYVAQFRRGVSHSRRAEVVAELEASVALRVPAAPVDADL